MLPGASENGPAGLALPYPARATVAPWRGAYGRCTLFRWRHRWVYLRGEASAVNNDLIWRDGKLIVKCPACGHEAEAGSWVAAHLHERLTGTCKGCGVALEIARERVFVL